MYCTEPLWNLTRHAPTQTQNEVESALLLYVVVCKRASFLELLACEYESLLVRRDALLVLYFAFYHFYCVCALDFKCDCLARQGFDKYLYCRNDKSLLYGLSWRKFQIYGGGYQQCLVVRHARRRKGPLHSSTSHGGVVCFCDARVRHKVSW